jgi:hypothetical protein
MRKMLPVIAVLAIVLAGCRIETNVILDIEEDGSALVGAEIGYDEEFRQLLEQSGANPDDLFADLPAIGEDVVTTERVEGDMTFQGVVSSVDDLSTVAVESTELEAFSAFSYAFDEDGATLSATVSAGDTGIGGGDLEELGFDPSQLTDEFFSANVVITMPGDVTENNADIVRSDGTLVWQIPLSGTKQIQATSSFGESSANLLLILLVGLLLIGVIVVVVATVISRRQSQQAVAVAAAGSGASVASDEATLEIEADADESGGVAATGVSAASDVPTAADDVGASEDVAPGDDAQADSPASSDGSTPSSDAGDSTEEGDGPQPVST